MEKNKITLRFSLISAMILLAAMSRLIPHPANFAPIGAMALFGAAHFSKRYWAFVIPIISMWISDLVLNNVVYGQYFDHFVWFYSGSLFTYAAFAFIVLMGIFTLKKVRIINLIGSALGASAIFFVVSNFGVWASSGMYPHTVAGLQACYIAGLPTLLGDFVYSGILFGLFEYAQFQMPSIRIQPAYPISNQV
jgi:hypothetical protein